MADDYGTPTPARIVWLVAAAGLVALLLAGGGWLAWRGVTDASSTPAPTTGPAVVPPGEVAFGAPQIRHGVPWGFPATTDGATAAAAVAVAVTGHPDVVFDPDRFDEVATVVFTPEQARIQARQVEAARAEFELSGWAAQPPSRRLYHFTPLAVRLTRFDPTDASATVEVWAMTLAGVGDTGGAVFTTSTVQLTATDAAWTVVGLDSAEGPTPMLASPASAPGRLRALLRDAAPVVGLPVGLGR